MMPPTIFVTHSMGIANEELADFLLHTKVDHLAGCPRVFHLHLGVTLPQLACGLNGSKKGMCHHLERLAVKGKLPLGGLLQLIAFRPLGLRQPCLFMDFTTQFPNLGCFHLCCLKVCKHFWSG